MATLALGALGTLIGGPVGGAIGALAGRQLDSAIIGKGSREGPRLNDLTISTSSYGSPIAKHYGKMRTAGTIIWATDLREDRETSGGGKGRPSTTSFSYSTSFAVALSSRPIADLGRIWADGTLLRGAAGDLKVGGSLRVHKGYGDQYVDPLIAAAYGQSCPAFRGLAYVVFEDLQLEDYGNRMPTLSFEVIGDEGEFSLQDIVEPLIEGSTVAAPLDDLTGFSYEGGPLTNPINTLAELYPLAAKSGDANLLLQPVASSSDNALMLPEAVPALDEGEFGQTNGSSRERKVSLALTSNAIRYYDTSRDYQPGVQRPEGRAAISGNQTLQFPGAITPDAARFLINRSASQASWANERLSWRLAELDPALAPGTLVEAPGIAGKWTVATWEWRERGVELVLERAPRATLGQMIGDPGFPVLPLDSLPLATRLHVFELAWDGLGSPNDERVYAALSSETSNWSGAALFAGEEGPLIPIGPSGRNQAIMGELTSPLESSPAILFEPNSYVDIETVSESMTFESVDLCAIANGQNRLVIGDELVQFSQATLLSPRTWRLSGLLRGRGGTESRAGLEHQTGTSVTLIDNRIVPLDPTLIPYGPATLISAIGRGDEEPVTATIGNRGVGLRPLTPVHPRVQQTPTSDLHICWTRRARGSWTWLDGVEIPLVEEVEIYRVGIGDVDTPDLIWEVDEPEITLTAAQVASHSGELLWVRQVGRASSSYALLLLVLP